MVLQTLGLAVMFTPFELQETLLKEMTKSRTDNDTVMIFFMMEQLLAKTMNVHRLHLRYAGGGLFYSICSSYHGCGCRSLNEPGLDSSHRQFKSYLIM
jgi:hypothetical protein